MDYNKYKHWLQLSIINKNFCYNLLVTTNKKVLLVDDDPSFIKLYTFAFKQRGINFSVASSGQEALEKITVERPDLVLLDIMMPGMSGFEVLMKLRQDNRFKNLPIWMLTNLGDEYGKDKSVDIGAQEYITKASTSPVIMCDKIINFFEGVATT